MSEYIEKLMYEKEVKNMRLLSCSKLILTFTSFILFVFITGISVETINAENSNEGQELFELVDETQNEIYKKKKELVDLLEEKIQILALGNESRRKKIEELIERKKIEIEQLERKNMSNESKEKTEDFSLSFLWPFGPDGWICRHLYRSAATQTERNFWNALGGGCDRR